MEHGLKDTFVLCFMFKTYSSSSSLVITSRRFATSLLRAPVFVRLVYWVNSCDMFHSYSLIPVLSEWWLLMSCHLLGANHTPSPIDLSYKSHNAPVLYPTMHHFVTEMCTCVHISVTKWCIVGCLTGFIVGFVRWVSSTWFGSCIWPKIVFLSWKSS